MICTIDELLADAAGHRPDNDAIKDGDAVWTYARLDREVARLAAELRAGGSERGDRVCIYMQKSLAQVLAILAVSRVQGVFVAANRKLKSNQVEFIARDCRVRLLLTDADGRDALDLAKWAHRPNVALVSVDPREGIVLSGLKVLRKTERETDSSRASVRTIRGDLACLMYTSGSTGPPKGVMVSHGNLLSGAQSVTSYLGIREDDRIISVLSFSFDYGLNQLLCALERRCLLVLRRTTFPQEIARTLKDESITVCAGIPSMWARMFHASHGVGLMAPFRSVRVVTNSGGKVSRRMLDAMERAFTSARIFLMYGLTEAFRSTYLPPEQLTTRPDSIGRSIPGAEVFLVNDDGRRARAGECGQIVHRGDTVAMGYWNRPEDTARVFRPNPFADGACDTVEYVVFSGDYARCDEDGYLYFLGRRDQQVKVSGMRISPEEVETVMDDIEGLAECVVLGTEGEEGDDVIVAFVLTDGPVERNVILRECRNRLPHYMVPRHIELCDSFPRLPNGKTDRAELKRRWIGSGGAGNAPGNIQTPRLAK